MKEFDEFDKFDIHDYLIQLKSMKLSFDVELDGGTKLSIDPTIEIKFDESTKFSLEDYAKMKKEDKNMGMYHITILDAIIGCVIGIGLGITAILLS